jgi:hypothetical protein
VRNPAHPPAMDADHRLAQELSDLKEQMRALSTAVQGFAVNSVPVVDVVPTAGRAGRVLFETSTGQFKGDTGTAWVILG